MLVITDFDQMVEALYSKERYQGYMNDVLLKCAWEDWKATGEVPDGAIVRVVPIPAAR